MNNKIRLISFILLCVLCVSATVITCIFGFNLSTEFKGGTQLNITLGNDLDSREKYNHDIDIIKNALEKFDLSVDKVQIYGAGEDAVLQVKSKLPARVSQQEATLKATNAKEEIQASLELEDDKIELVNNNGFVTLKTILTYVFAYITMLAVVMIFTLITLGWREMLTLLYSNLIAFVAIACAVLICRFEISITLIDFVAIISFIITTTCIYIQLAGSKSNISIEENKKRTLKDVMESVM